MILTSSSVSELSNSLSWWERGEYFFSFIVAGACFGEYVADFRPRWYETGDAERDLKRKESISKISTLVLVAALVFELVCVAKSNTFAGRVIGSINDLAISAAGQSKTALDNAGKAQALAQSASDIAKPAKDEADAAEREAQVAMDQLGIVESFVSSRHVIDAKPLDKLELRGKPIAVFSWAGDGEARYFCESIVKALHNFAGMDPSRSCGALEGGIESGSFEPEGSFVFGPDSSENQAIANALTGATHTEFRGGQNPNNGSLRVMVGQKIPFRIGK